MAKEFSWQAGSRKVWVTFAVSVRIIADYDAGERPSIESAGRGYTGRCGSCPERLAAIHSETLCNYVDGETFATAYQDNPYDPMKLLRLVSVGIGPVSVSLDGSVKLGESFHIGPLVIKLQKEVIQAAEAPQLGQGVVSYLVNYTVSSRFDGQAPPRGLSGKPGEDARYTFGAVMGLGSGKLVKTIRQYEGQVGVAPGEQFGVRHLASGHGAPEHRSAGYG